MKKYFQTELAGVTERFLLDVRARIVLTMLEKNGIITGKSDGEDSQGRAKLSEMPPIEVVQRAFAIAEEFISVCEEKKYIKPCELTEELAMVRKIKLERLSYKINE